MTQGTEAKDLLGAVDRERDGKFAARDESAPHHLVRVEFESRDFRSWVKFSQFGELPAGQAVQAQAGMESYFDSLQAYLA